MSLEKMLDFTGRNVLVTGGSSGIGNAIARSFLDAGARVQVWGSRPSREDYAAEEGSNLEGLDYQCVDLGNLQAIADARVQSDTLDILVQSQGACAWEKEYDPAHFREVVEVNLNGIMATCMKFYEFLKASGGKVVLINSVGGIKPSLGIPAYSASKAGVTSLTKSLGEAWAAEGIRVNGIAPGPILTKMTGPVLSQPGRTEANIERIPLGRLGTSQDIANIALFLASDLSAFVVGHTILADGGMLIR
ncbi:MAG: SDR family oxidoreductase [Halieaceae bacterium]|nr:SDR family oxidoreductase [Halieaceae bacterium]